MNPDHLAQQQQQQQQQDVKGFEVEDPNDSAGDQESDGEKPARRSGRRKIKIEYIEDKNRRHITFSKRKAGIMKKAYELSTLTGTQVLLLVVSETGLVYTFTTVKLQPIVTKPEGKNLIQACLNAPDPMSVEQSGGDASYNTSPQISEKKVVYEDKKQIEAPTQQSQQAQPQQGSSAGANNTNAGYNGYQQQAQAQAPPQQGYQANSGNGYQGYNMASTGSSTSTYQQSPQQQAQQPYGQMPQPTFYGNQQQPYNLPPHQPQQAQQPYWQPGAGQREDDSRRKK